MLTSGTRFPTGLRSSRPNALTCGNVIKQQLCQSARPVRDEEAAGSNPATPIQVKGRFPSWETAFLVPVRHAQARTARYAARQARERASTAVDRLQRRVRELAGRLDRAAELTP
jgi:hypothetical protein